MVLFGLFRAGSTLADPLPGPDPQRIWDYITRVSPYKNWSYWPDHQDFQKGKAPHGSLHRVFVNDRALASQKPPLRNGSIQVKENYNQKKQLKAITVMVKISGYHPEGGDWYWVKYHPNGKARPFGKVGGCIDCHGERAQNDFVMVHNF